MLKTCCPECKSRFKVSLKALGKPATCPKCGYLFSVQNTNTSQQTEAPNSTENNSVNQYSDILGQAEAIEEVPPVEVNPPQPQAVPLSEPGACLRLPSVENVSTNSVDSSCPTKKRSTFLIAGCIRLWNAFCKSSRPRQVAIGMGSAVVMFFACMGMKAIILPASGEQHPVQPSLEHEGNQILSHIQNNQVPQNSNLKPEAPINRAKEPDNSTSSKKAITSTKIISQSKLYVTNNCLDTLQFEIHTLGDKQSGRVTLKTDWNIKPGVSIYLTLNSKSVVGDWVIFSVRRADSKSFAPKYWHHKHESNGDFKIILDRLSVHDPRPANYSDLPRLEKEARQGKANALGILGVLYRDGIVVKPDHPKAMKYLQDGASQNDVRALNGLATLYYDGSYLLNLKPDRKKSLELDTRAAKLGDASAQYNVGDVYHHSHSWKIKNIKKACYWYQKAADQDDPHALRQMALQHEIGSPGVNRVRNGKKAEELYLKAAKLGFVPVFNDLGTMYYEGARGIPRDYDKAIRWFSQAVDLGSPHAKKNIAKITGTYRPTFKEQLDSLFSGVKAEPPRAGLRTSDIEKLNSFGNRYNNR